MVVASAHPEAFNAFNILQVKFHQYLIPNFIPNAEYSIRRQDWGVSWQLECTLVRNLNIEAGQILLGQKRPNVPACV